MNFWLVYFKGNESSAVQQPMPQFGNRLGLSGQPGVSSNTSSLKVHGKLSGQQTTTPKESSEDMDRGLGY